jgi:ankyrin repeat protein
VLERPCGLPEAHGLKFSSSEVASRGAEVDLEAAAGIGRYDLVKACFDEHGRLKPPSTLEQMKDGFAWACEFGRADVVRFLIERGMDMRARLKHHGQTGLHWAAGGGHLETARILVEHGAPVDATDEEWNATPVQWALHGWQNRSTALDVERYYAVVRLLVAAGATIRPEWLDDEAVRADPAMQEALRGP